MKRTWYRNQSDGTFFRNTSLVRLDQKRFINRVIPFRMDRLHKEWIDIFRAGVTRVESIPSGDWFIDYDDSPEATEIWVRQFLALNSNRSTSG